MVCGYNIQVWTLFYAWEELFKGVGHITEEKEILKTSTKCVEISLFSDFNILVGILFGPENLLLLSEDIMETTSSLSVGVIKNNLNFHHEVSLCNFYL